MTDEEIMIRAREAEIAVRKVYGFGVEFEDAVVRSGERDHAWTIISAVQALRDISKPLDQIRPVDPDLIEVRKILAEDSRSKRLTSRASQLLDGELDGMFPVPSCLAALKRGRELEREAVK